MVVCVRERMEWSDMLRPRRRETANLIADEVAPLLVENDFATLSLWFSLAASKLGSRLWLP